MVFELVGVLLALGTIKKPDWYDFPSMMAFELFLQPASVCLIYFNPLHLFFRGLFVVRTDWNRGRGFEKCRELIGGSVGHNKSIRGILLYFTSPS